MHIQEPTGPQKVGLLLIQQEERQDMDAARTGCESSRHGPRQSSSPPLMQIARCGLSFQEVGDSQALSGRLRGPCLHLKC